jgi:phage terminase large subunit GpA-like protein
LPAPTAARSSTWSGGRCTDPTRWRAIRRGIWRATAPFRGIAGFHLNQIYSPWARLAELATEFLSAKRSPDTLKTFVNTVLGESWEDQGQRVSGGDLAARLEEWGDKAPAQVLCVTCGVDVQDDRLEVERVGWGLDDESWSLEHRIFYGDPSALTVWKEIDDYLQMASETADGRTLRVMATAVDSGGHHTQAVYRFCRARFGRRVYAIKGFAGQGRPVWPKRAGRAKQGGALLFAVGVDAAKDSIMARLRIAEPGPGYCHFPAGRDPAYLEQFGAETKVTKKVKGFPVMSWVKRDGARNEAIDLRVYAFAALQALNVNWSRVRAKLDGRIAAPRRETPPAPAAVSEMLRPEADDPPGQPLAPRPRRAPGRRRAMSNFMSG